MRLEPEEKDVKQAAEPSAADQDTQEPKPAGTPEAGGDKPGREPGDADEKGGPAAGDRQDEPVRPKKEDYADDPQAYAEALEQYVDATSGKLPKAVRDELSQSRKRAREEAAKREEAERRAAEAERKAIEREQGELKEPVPPDPNDFVEGTGKTRADYDAAMQKYRADLGKYYQDKSALEAKVKERQGLDERSEAERQQQRTAKWSKTVREAATREDLPNFHDVAFSEEMAQVTRFSDGLAASIMDSDHGADLAYYLGSNPDEAWRLADIRDPILLGKEIGRLEARISARAPEKKSVTRAPEPVGSLKGGGAAPEPDLEKMSMDDFARLRNEQDRKRLERQMQG